MEFISGTGNGLAPEVIDQIGRYRHRVFIDTLGWGLTASDGKEQDQFDGNSTVYFAVRRSDQEVIGVARLLPTTGPYLLGDVFPELMGGAPVPKRADVWELSRYAAVDFDSTDTSPMQQFSSPSAIQLLREVLAYAARQGVKRLITVSPLGVERLLRRAGFLASRAAPPINIDGHALFACWIEVPALPSSQASDGAEIPERSSETV